MESIGMKDFRTGPINEVVSLAFYPELGTPVPLETYVCKGCGKLELFANSPDVAEDILQGLISSAPGEEVYLDVPEPNGSAIALAQMHGMRPVFATARMYTRRVLDLPLGDIYGITSFELG